MPAQGCIGRTLVVVPLLGKGGGAAAGEDGGKQQRKKQREWMVFQFCYSTIRLCT